ASLIRRGLREEGLLADVAITGEDALWMAACTEYDVIVLDVMLPGIDGLETCRRLRADGVRTPILMLTARGEVADRIEGLTVGGDDYLTKPFAFGELIARMHALGRRGEIERLPVLEVDELKLDPMTHRVSRGDRQLELRSARTPRTRGAISAVAHTRPWASADPPTRLAPRASRASRSSATGLTTSGSSPF
ncbi:MAG: response regulator transcription factor, partial [Solirubrobacteraceae bacterium]